MKPIFKKELMGFKNSTNILIGITGINLVLFLILLIIKHYPPLVMIIHMLSLIVLWGVVFYGSGISKLLRSRWKEVLLLVGLVLIAFFVRMYRVEEITPGMYGDERTVAVQGLGLYNQPDWPPYPDKIYPGYTHPTPLMYLTADSVNLFGHTRTAIRLPSIIFGALAVCAFYVLLRLFFPLPIALAGAVFMLFQYTDVILSRLAYEPIPSIFFQILWAIFFILYTKTKDNRYLLGVALALGLGFYTYLNFRTFAAVVFLLGIFYLLGKQWKCNILSVVLFSLAVFIAMMPLVSSEINDPAGFWAEVGSISVFSRGYSPTETMKELGGSMYRTAILPFYSNPNPPAGSPPFSGDPNPDKNPSDVQMFDPITVLLAILGLIYLFTTKRKVFWILLLLLIPSYVSDVFSTEIIPEFHYYGLGHPNALRVSGFIPIVLFAATAGLWWGYKKLEQYQSALGLTVLTILVLTVSIWNWHWYFDQAQNSPVFYLYNYQVNHGKELQITDYLNKIQTNTISMNKDLANDLTIQFFLAPKHPQAFDLTSTASAMKAITNSDITVIDVTQNSIPILNSLVNMQSSDVYVQLVRNPINQPVAVIFQKAGLQPSL